MLSDLGIDVWDQLLCILVGSRSDKSRLYSHTSSVVHTSERSHIHQCLKKKQTSCVKH